RGGSNLSHGQQQLIMLARALINKSKVIIFDEATANVDLETDFKLQKSIREEFKDSTLLYITHRLKTVIDYDRILVFWKCRGIRPSM
ncbi:14504_t:CDS:2, partial [Dentiscutata heterogama]